MTENQEEIGKKLSKVRRLHGETLEHLAGRLGVTKSYLSKIENGHKTVSPTLMRKFAVVYEGSSAFSALFGGHKININEGERGQGMDNKQVQAPMPELEVNLNVDKTPTLYSDWQNVYSNDGGVVLNFGQSTGPGGSQHIVARIGLSHAQAKELYRVLGENQKNYYKSKNMEF